MARPVPPTLVGLSSTGLTRTPPANMVIAEVRPPRARLDEEVEKMGPVVASLAL